jgi:hypothetical protein
MIDLLERFKENEIQNKDDLLYSLQSIYDNFDSDTSAPQARKELLEKFIKHIDAMQLPRCDDWWFYSYDFTRFGMVLDMCHCVDFSVESEDEFTMTIDEAFTVTEITCDMMTVAEFAALHHVQPVAVRQWIRRGKLRAIKKRGRDWLIASIAEKPSRNYKPVKYEWDGMDREMYKEFPFLTGVKSIRISQSMENKTVFVVRSDMDRETVINAADCEKLELALLAWEEIEVFE